MSPSSRTNLGIAALTLLVLLVGLCFRDLIPRAGGVGYDGAAYAHWTKVLSLSRLQRAAAGEEPGPGAVRLDSYHARRVLPSILAHYALRMVGAAPTKENVIRTFTAANLAFITLAVWLWCVAADELGVSRRARWLALPGLVFSYANLKMPLYYPVLTDSFALALGSASLALHLKRRPLGVLATSLAGGLVWPTAPLFGALLVALPYRGAVEPEPAPRGVATGAAGAIALAGFATTEALLVAGYQIPATPVRPLPGLAHLGAVITGLVLFFGLRPLLDSAELWRSVEPRRLLRSPWFYAACAMFAAVEALVRGISVAPPRFGPLGFAMDTFWTSATQPATFLLAHVLYYGPLLAFVPFVWPGLCRTVKRHGPGLVACFAFAVVLGVGSESRKWINFLPFLLLFLVQALDGIATSPRRLALLAVLALAFSKVWLPMDRALELPFLGEVPWRTLYVSSRGPWIDGTWYAIQAVPVLLVAWLAWRQVAGAMRGQ